MAFPQVASITPTSFGTNATQHLVAMPLVVNVDELLVMFIAFDGAPVVTTPSGWTLKQSLENGDVIHAVFAKKALGNEGGTTVDVVTGDPEKGAAQVYRIQGWNGTITSVGVRTGGGLTGTSTAPNPGQWNPTNWDIEDTLWIASYGADDDDDASAYPANYTNGTYTESDASADSASLGTARRENAVASEDPGAFTIAASEEWVVWTTAVRPGSAGTPVSQPFAASGAATSTGSVVFSRVRSFAAAGASASSGTVAFSKYPPAFFATAASVSDGSITFTLVGVPAFAASGASQSSGSLVMAVRRKFLAEGGGMSSGSVVFTLFIPPYEPAVLGLRHVFTPASGSPRTLPDPEGTFPRQVVHGFTALGQAPGGFISAAATISEDEFDANPGIYQWGTTWRIFNDDDGGRVVWAGRLVDPEVAGGVALLHAEGWGTLADKDFEHLLWQTRDLDAWTVANSDPHNYDIDDQIVADINGRRVRFKVKRKEMFLRATGETTLNGAVTAGATSITVAVNAGGLAAGEAIFIDGEKRIVAGSYTGSTSIPLTVGLSRDHANGKKVHWHANNNPDQWATGIVFWAPQVNLQRIAFTIDKERSTTEYDVQLLKATGPDGALTVVATYSLASGQPTNIDQTFAGNPDLLMIRLRRQSQTEKARAFKVDIKDIRVNGPFTALDTYSVDKVVKDIAARIGGTTTGVDASATNALPIDVEDVNAGAILDELGLLVNRFWAVEDDGTAKAWKFKPWTSQTWVLTTPQSPVGLVPLERFNVVRVPYRYPGGVRDYVKKTATVNPLSPSVNVRQIDLADPLPPKFIAEAFAQNLADDLVEERYSGTATFVSVEDLAAPGTLVSGWRVRAGDRLKLPNNNNLILRIEEVTYGEDFVTVRFSESNPLLERVLARRSLILARGRGNAWATLGGFDLERPKVPANVTLAFKEAEKRGGRRKWHAVVDWDEVTRDIEENATAIQRYIVQFRPVDAAGTPITEANGGGIHRVVIDRKNLDDPEIDDLPTKAWLRNLEHPHSWRWQARVGTADVFTERSHYSGWTAYAKPAAFAPAAPTNLTLTKHRGKLEADWDANDPSETETDAAPSLDRSVAYYKVKKFRDGTQRGKTIRTRSTGKTWRLVKPWTGAWRVDVVAVDDYGNESSVVQQTVNAKKPGKVRNRSVTSKRHAVTVTWDPPNAWSDATTTDWDVSEVARYEVRLYTSGGTLVDSDAQVLTTHKTFHVASGTTGLKASIIAVGHDEDFQTEDAATGSATAQKADTVDLEDNAVTVDKLHADSITAKHTIVAAKFRTDASDSNARIVLDNPGSGENDRVKVYGSGGTLVGAIKADSGDLVLSAASPAKIAVIGGLIIRTGADLQIGSVDDNTNRIDFRGTTEGQVDPATSHCYLWYDISGTPKILKARFPNGTVKTVANDA